MLAIAPAAATPDDAGRRQGPLVFTLSNGDYLALDNASDRPIRGIQAARGTTGAIYWRDDGLRAITWRGDIARVDMPPDGHSATITNAYDRCLTVVAADDIRWAPCQGGNPAQVWTVADDTLVAPALWQGYLAHDDTGVLDGRIHLVRGEPPMSLVTSALHPVD